MNNDVCPICIHDIEEDEGIILPCGHQYHTLCYNDYIEYGYAVCCLCQYKIYSIDDDEYNNDRLQHFIIAQVRRYPTRIVNRSMCCVLGTIVMIVVLIYVKCIYLLRTTTNF